MDMMGGERLLFERLGEREGDIYRKDEGGKVVGGREVLERGEVMEGEKMCGSYPCCSAGCYSGLLPWRIGHGLGLKGPRLTCSYYAVEIFRHTHFAASKYQYAPQGLVSYKVGFAGWLRSKVVLLSLQLLHFVVTF